MPAMPPPPSARAPPSSQPVLPARNRSAFPSLQRPRPNQPPSFGRASSIQTQARPQSQAQTPWRESQTPSQSQSQRPNSNRLDNRYSPPSSQPTQLFASQAQSQSQRPRQISRPPSSQSQVGLGIVDQYRPDSIPMPRSAADVYRGERPSTNPPKAQKGVEILEKIAGLSSMIEEKFTKKEEDDSEFQEALEDRLKGLEDENKDLKERIHELSMGQKVLPTKSELNEEISSQLTPALNDFCDSLQETLTKTITPLPDSTAELAAGKVKVHMLEMQDLARKEAVREGAVENPLMTLLNHLITKLNPLDDITTTLASLSGLPEALEQVAVFRETMKNMQDRISSRPEPQAQAQISQIPSLEYSAQITKLQETIEEVMKKVDTPPPPTVGLDSGKVFGAITGLKRGLEELKTSFTANPLRTATGGDDGMKEMKDLVLGMKAEIVEIKNTLATITLPPDSAAVDSDTASTLRAILERLKSRPVPQGNIDTPTPVTGQAHTPTTGIRPQINTAPLDPVNENTQSSPRNSQSEIDLGHETSTPRASGRPIRPTPWALQDPATMRVIARRGLQPEIASVPGSDIFGTIHPIPIDLTSTNTANKKRRIKPTSTLKFTLPIPKAFSNQTQSQESQSTSSQSNSTSSVVNKKKRKTPPNSLGMRPTTRSDVNRAKAVGIDLHRLELESTESNGKKGKKKNSGSGSSEERGQGIVPITSNTGDTTWPLGFNSGIGSLQPDTDTRPDIGFQDLPIEIETPPLPHTQDLGQSQPEAQPESRPESQNQTQTQTQTQLNNSQTDSTFEFGHGQLPSVPSLPGYESTQFETQVDTMQRESEKEVTSTEHIEQSLALPGPRRAEPSYRKYQAPRTYGGSSKMHGFLKGNFGLLEDSDDE